MKWRNINTPYIARLDELKKQTAYEILGIDEGASMSEAKKAYKKKMSLYHPDRNDPFMKEYSQEVAKLLNAAIEKVENILNTACHGEGDQVET